MSLHTAIVKIEEERISSKKAKEFISIIPPIGGG